MNDLVAALRLAQSQVSKHLRVLRGVGLVSVCGSGQQRLYKFSADGLKLIHDWVHRDLGENAGHFWGHVQVIKPPTLLEFCGPFFMSFPAANHMQYRLTAEGHGTRLELTHQALGQIPQKVRERMPEAWDFMLKRVGEIAERLSNKRGARLTARW